MRLSTVLCLSLATLVGASSSPAIGDPQPPDLLAASAEKDGLRLSARVLPADRTRQHVIRVGDPLEVEVSVTNLGSSAVNVPLEEMTEVHLRQERRYPGLTFGGGFHELGGLSRVGRSPPYHARKVDPGASASFTRTGSPVFAGAGHIEVHLANVAAATAGASIPPLSLWTGHVHVEIPLEVSAGGYTSPRGTETLALRQLGWRERLSAMSLLASDAPDERSVWILQEHLKREGTPRSKLHPMEWCGILMHLLVAAHRGYGLDALSEHVAAAADRSALPEVRAWGLEGAALALQLGVRGFVLARNRGDFDSYLVIEGDPALRRKARAIVEALAATPGDPLQPRAKAVLGDPGTLPPQDPPPR
jgi:hypothetical protein